MTSEDMKIYSDGGARGNPGPAAAAFVIVSGGKIIHQDSIYLGNKTNNFAEYSGVLIALNWVNKNKRKINSGNIYCYMDSELVAKQLNGEYKVKSKTLATLVKNIKNLEKKFKEKINFISIPRSKNKIADYLVNKELDEKLK